MHYKEAKNFVNFPCTGDRFQTYMGTSCCSSEKMCLPLGGVERERDDGPGGVQPKRPGGGSRLFHHPQLHAGKKACKKKHKKNSARFDLKGKNSEGALGGQILRVMYWPQSVFYK